MQPESFQSPTLNVEIVLRTVLNLSSAVNWLKSTFFYARLKKNPQYYGVGLDKNTLMLNNESRIEMCLKELELENKVVIQELGRSI